MHPRSPDLAARSDCAVKAKVGEVVVAFGANRPEMEVVFGTWSRAVRYQEAGLPRSGWEHES